jgi:hypothetical protein
VTSLDKAFFESLRWLLECGFDWITWRLPAAFLGIDHDANEFLQNDPFALLSSIQNWQKEHTAKDRPAPAIAIEYPWRNGYHASEMLHRGADVVVLPSCSNILRESFKDATANPPSDTAFPMDSLGATLGYRASSFMKSVSRSVTETRDQTSSSIHNTKQCDVPSLELFVSQFKSFRSYQNAHT